MRDSIGKAGAIVVIRLNSRNRHPSDSLTVPSTLNANSSMVINDSIANVGMASENLNKLVGVHSANCVQDRASGARRTLDCIMSDDEEHVNWAVNIQGIEEPLLFDHFRSRSDDAGIGVTCEIKQDSECHDANAMVGGEVSVL